MAENTTGTSNADSVSDVEQLCPMVKLAEQYQVLNQKQMLLKYLKTEPPVNAELGQPSTSSTTASGAPASATKFDSGKPRITLVPAETIEGMAAVFTFGAKKYGAYNFRKGMSHSRALDAALRHILAITRGEVLDSESGLPHVYHAMCSLAIYNDSRLFHPELKDLYEPI